MKMTGGQKQVLVTRSAVGVERWKGYLVCRAMHGPPGHGMFEAWLRQQDAIECDLHRVIAEDALRILPIASRNACAQAFQHCRVGLLWRASYSLTKVSATCHTILRANTSRAMKSILLGQPVQAAGFAALGKRYCVKQLPL